MNARLRRQLSGRGRGIADARVLAAMDAVPRGEFVPEGWKRHADEDRPLPIGDGQTISQPFIVAYMTERLGPRPGSRVLEIGAGCGYQSAILAEMGARVFAIEIVAALAARAAETLRRLGYAGRVSVRHGDGAAGWPDEAPFDGILVACAARDVPRPLLEQLSPDGGRLILPLHDPAGGQDLVEFRRDGERVARTRLIAVRFVPMTGGAPAAGDAQAP